MTKHLGAIYTPVGYARILTKWAIQAKTDSVLDMGVGPGVFVYQAHQRLTELGATFGEADKQIYGTEIDTVVFNNFVDDAMKQGHHFQHIENHDFFDWPCPQVDAIVGNPPYIRRRQMGDDEYQKLQKKTKAANPFLEEKKLSALTDLYVYFLLAALPNLKPGGRLATIVADSWLNTRYGNVLKEYLNTKCNIEQLISLDRSVFNAVQVKAVLLLATKQGGQEERNKQIRFSRVKNGLSLDELSSFVFEEGTIDTDDIVIQNIEGSSLDPKTPWGAIFKSSELIKDIQEKRMITPIQNIADVRIGLQTLAKDFFVLSPEQVAKHIVEEQFLKPFAQSVADFSSPVIAEGEPAANYLFFCDKDKDTLRETRALDYIEAGECKDVTIRGKNITVSGYQNKKRIIRANRPHWYDVKTKIEKSDIAEILLPRFVYKEYSVLWNQAMHIPGGAVIQFFPKRDLFFHDIDIRVYLAILTSSFSEIIFRISAQVYGGGASSFRISVIKESPTIDVLSLSLEQKDYLIEAYDIFLQKGDRRKIDQIIYQILELSDEQIEEVEKLLCDLLAIAESAKKTAHPGDKNG